MTVDISFLGASGTVTGSRYLLEAEGKRILVDCGLFQGYKTLRQRNWKPFPVDPASIDAVVLTHAHLDHSGYLPRLVRHGFTGRIHCTGATRDLCEILLLDSAYLNEQDAERANRYGYTKHKPALPLYDRDDAKASLSQLVAWDFETRFEAAHGVGARFRRAGHILGAASVQLTLGGRVVVFSGDIGRFDSPTMPDPRPFETADALVIESTYGDRSHGGKDVEDDLAEAITETTERGGTVLVPSFAVGRAHSLLFHLMRLKRAGRIPDLPVFLDSPMAINAADIYCAHLQDHKLTAAECRALCAVATYTRSADESRALNTDPMPKIIISASGMATGGRVLHHLKRYLPDPRNMILFAGFQAGGTRGATLVAGGDRVKIHGAYHEVRAEVRNLRQLSAHADRDELLRWLGGFRSAPGRIFVTHGEPESSDAFRKTIEEEYGWPAETPDHLERVTL
ncbi:MBL fold metallo-hydrolase [Actibacterium sp. MT2.3-13A]|uniref:MBL fold metallo-hydrolase RNA specificity domain-containing protein n=1 Tax=Actibacterium sp. MT2.3-13A TaxID=2828332 RepID=UPI001BA7539C|nr:MBL fold metallo-hydrolase [Actibacterium sp. MT2.3-13A]